MRRSGSRYGATAFDDIVRRDDEVDAEVVPRIGQVVVDDLQSMHRGDDRRARSGATLPSDTRWTGARSSPTPNQPDEVLDRLHATLRDWVHTTTSDGVAVFDRGRNERITVRASGTEPGTRLYLEAPRELVDRIITKINGST